MNKQLILLGLATATSAQLQAATLVLGETLAVDFGTIAPTASANFNQFDAFNNSIADGASLAWSALPGNAAADMINTLGVAVSDIDVTVENQSGQNTSRANVTNGSTGPAPFNDGTIFQDSIISNNQGAAPLDPGGFLTITVSGLDDSLTYDLFGGYDGINANFDSTWAADGQSFLSTPGATTGYQTLAGLTTDGSGNLAITVTRNSLHVNAGSFTLTAAEAIPEPSTALLSGLAGLALLTRRRR